MLYWPIRITHWPPRAGGFHKTALNPINSPLAALCRPLDAAPAPHPPSKPPRQGKCLENPQENVTPGSQEQITQASLPVANLFQRIISYMKNKGILCT